MINLVKMKFEQPYDGLLMLICLIGEPLLFGFSALISWSPINHRESHIFLPCPFKTLSWLPSSPICVNLARPEKEKKVKLPQMKGKLEKNLPCARRAGTSLEKPTKIFHTFSLVAVVHLLGLGVVFCRILI